MKGIVKSFLYEQGFKFIPTFYDYHLQPTQFRYELVFLLETKASVFDITCVHVKIWR